MENHTFKILIVEDSPENIDILGGLLADYKRTVAVNGEKAMAILESGNFPDLVLLDIEMPGINGFEVCKRIRAVEKYNNIPIIFLTSRTDKESMITGFELGGQDYVTKPFDKNELMARVRTQLELKHHKDKLEDLVALRTKQLQEAYEELEVLDTAKSEFLNMVSHEIRTPLNGIQGFLGVLKLKIDSDELQVFISHLDESAKRLEEFSLRALSITSLRTKNHPLNLTQVDIVEMVNSILKDKENVYSEKGITVSFPFSEKSLSITADASLLQQLIAEILKNIELHSATTKEISVFIELSDTETKVKISDDGNGFSEKALENLFQPFGFGQQHIDGKIGLGLHFMKLSSEIQGIQISAGNKPEGGAFVELVFTS